MSRSTRFPFAFRGLLAFAIAAISFAGTARAQQPMARVSVDSSGAEADVGASNPALSADGRFVVFDSDADDLVAHDTNHCTDVFLHDRDPDGNGIYDEGSGETRRVSVDSSGKQAWGWCQHAQISADGTCVVFESYAANLVSGDTNGVMDIFVRDRNAHTTERVSVNSSGSEANDLSLYPSISSDGRVVAFLSFASNLVPLDTNKVPDVFVHDRASGTTLRVSVDSAGNQGNGFSETWRFFLSDDGNFVAFRSAAGNLVANDTNQAYDAFVHDVAASTTVRVSVDSTGAQSAGNVRDASISRDGSAAVFTSDGGDLGPRDVNGVDDCFRHDLVTGTTDPISIDFATNSGDGPSRHAVANSDGSLVAFTSEATDLVDGDTNGLADVFVFDRGVVPLQGSWTYYGAGLAGTLGVPNLTLSADPEFGASPALAVDNSAGAASVAFLVVGTTRASLPVAGGTLLVLPGTIATYGLPLAGLSLGFTVPYDRALFGFVLDVQAIEFDPGASKGLSFTPGLELVFGQ